jgi:hypothetical protein
MAELIVTKSKKKRTHPASRRAKNALDKLVAKSQKTEKERQEANYKLLLHYLQYNLPLTPELIAYVELAKNQAAVPDPRFVKTCKECFSDVEVTQKVFDEQSIFICRECRGENRNSCPRLGRLTIQPAN